MDIGMRIPGIGDGIATRIAKQPTPYGLTWAARALSAPGGYTYQTFRNNLCELFRGTFSGPDAAPALAVLRERLNDFSAEKDREQHEHEKNDIDEQKWIDMSSIRYAIADVLSETDDHITKACIAEQLPHEWSRPIVEKMIAVLGDEAKTIYIDSLLGLLKSHTFRIRSMVAEMLSGTDNVHAQCAMVDALMDSCRVRIEECAASMWDTGTRTIQDICTALLGTELSDEAKNKLREGLLDPSSAYFSVEILEAGKVIVPAQAALDIISRDPDQFIEMVRMSAEIDAKAIVEKEARAEGIQQVDWNDERWEKRWEYLVREIEKTWT